MPGLSFLFNAQAVTVPTDTKPTFKAGFDLSNANTKLKFYVNLQNFLLENTFTYLVNPSTVIGANLTFNPSSSRLEKYDFGLNHLLQTGTNVGVKHESTSKDALKIGKFFFYFFHNANAFQTVGTEFTFDYATKAHDARLAFLHKFDDTVSSKVKVNNLGQLDALLKIKLSETTTASLTSGFNLRSIYEQKVRGMPLGVSFDIKF